MTKDELVMHLIDKQFDIIGKVRPSGCFDDPEWYQKYSLTYEEYREFKEYSINKISSVLKTKKQKGTFSVSTDFDWFMLMFGFRYNFDYRKILC